jgi:DNA polymerase-3 subunit delta
LSRQDASSIFGMVVRQFRLILLGKEILDSGGGENEIASTLKVHPYVARKVTAQARRFTQPDLEAIYHRLLSIDVATKSSEMDADLSLDLLIADLMA